MLRRLFVVVTFGHHRPDGRTRAHRPHAQRGGHVAAPASEPQAAAQTRPAPPAAAPAALPDLTGIAQRAIGSVTNISSTQVVRTPLTNDPFFRYFFRDDDLYRERRQQSLGSGVVVSADGYVLTNNHVVGSAGADVRVGFSDKRELRAKVVGTDPLTDLAVLKLDADEPAGPRWGDSSKLRVAEWVLAIGNPFQLNQTVTLGIVSATNRRLEGRVADYEDFIQTDAAINPGNSGGALINARGELVGINTAIYSESGGYQGIGFAVPSNLARHVMDDIIKYGSVRRGTIRGIQLQPMTPQIANELGAAEYARRARPRRRPPSDAYAAGLRQDDIIVGFNGTTIDDASQFIRLLSDAEIGSTATLTVIREGRQRTVSQVEQVRAGPGQRCWRRTESREPVVDYCAGSAVPAPIRPRPALERRHRGAAGGSNTASACSTPTLIPTRGPRPRRARGRLAILDAQRATPSGRAGCASARCRARASGCRAPGTDSARREIVRAPRRCPARAGGASASRLRAARARGSAPRPASPSGSVTAFTR